ncbi:MAG: AmmeMemoRadiSam system radical SAM enzyme [Candidatus Kaelpia aquatica]|nr:AmmeMemoRadiSam system radical SAM enzyme [Candidatus Kaelpia aquatica]
MKREAYLYHKIEDSKVRCFLCNHNCVIIDSEYGFCGVRKNEKGILYSDVYAEPAALHVDPIEKKPLYHFYPGSLSYSMATIGCNFRCEFCQNWQISQRSKSDFKPERIVLPEDIAYYAKENNCSSISYTYTEPTVFFEYAYDIAKIAHKEGLHNIFVTNGYMSTEAIDKIAPYLNAANVDLKSFNDGFYVKNCKAHLKPVLDSIKYMKERGIWIEITTLIIPGENDSGQELMQLADFVASVGVEIPWHISRFHPDYKYLKSESTPIETLKMAKEIARSRGLRYVYLGNVFEGNDSLCYNCAKLLIKRSGLNLSANNLDSGSCPYCGVSIDGLF